MKTSGPCLCGDVACPSCESPGAAEAEVAEEALMDRLAEEKITPNEYHIVAEVGIAAVKAHREVVEKLASDRLADQAEYIRYLEDKVENHL